MSQRPRNRQLADDLRLDPGLCGTCRHRAFVRSASSVFLRCGRSDADSEFRRYPPLPVLECRGHEPEE